MFDSSYEHYEAENFDVACVDDRTTKARDAYIGHLGDEYVDMKTPAGATRVFSSPEHESDREYWFRELQKSIDFHGIKKVRFWPHHDCGAYGGFSRFDNDREVEFEYHVVEHRKAVEIIHERYPDMPVESYFQDENGIVRIS